jgi:hypothetical protein
MDKKMDKKRDKNMDKNQGFKNITRASSFYTDQYAAEINKMDRLFAVDIKPAFHKLDPILQAEFNVFTHKLMEEPQINRHSLIRFMLEFQTNRPLLKDAPAWQSVKNLAENYKICYSVIKT